MSENKILKFPQGFLWGASTSAYQIEGGIINDWSEWEKQESRIKELKLRNLNPEDFISGRACDSYNRYEEDIELVKQLNCGGFRFGIEWARIEPEKGKYNMDEVEHYRKVLQSLKDKKIKSIVTLWHWTNPIWLAQEGGWTNGAVVDHFARFTQLIIDELGDLIDFWVTLNEPLMHIAHGYLDGKFPPNRKADFIGSYKVFNNLVHAHKSAYKIIHTRYPDAKVSITMTTGFIEPANRYNPIEVLIAKAAHYLRNNWYIYRIKGYYDFLGVNYYHHDRIVWYPPFKKNLNEKLNDFGWEIYPEGIYHVLMNYKKFKKPIYILENGTADEDDDHRPQLIIDHLKYVHKAIGDGANVQGYFHWSLLDNFEWADGYGMKFGLFAIEKNTFKRIARPSAKLYADICKTNSLMIN